MHHIGIYHRVYACVHIAIHVCAHIHIGIHVHVHIQIGIHVHVHIIHVPVDIDIAITMIFL